MLKKVKKSKLPLISVIIPSFNKAKFIEETLTSIIDQNYLNLEVLVQDGGSTDGTLEIIKKYAKKFPKIFKFVSKKDKGQADAINTGIKKAKGDIVTYICADDVYESGAFLQVSEAFKKHPKAYWFAGKGVVIDEEGLEVATYVTTYKNALLTANSYQFLLIVNYLYQPSVFLTKKGISLVGKFRGIAGIVMEYESWLKLGKQSMPYVINKNLSKFRMSGDNASSLYFDKTLSKDLEIAKKYTQSKLLLFLHSVHNDLRKIVLHSLK